MLDSNPNLYGKKTNLLNYRTINEFIENNNIFKLGSNTYRNLFCTFLNIKNYPSRFKNISLSITFDKKNIFIRPI